jgi:small multidrug resistance pump
VKASALLVIVGLSLLGVAGDALIKLAGQGPKVDSRWFLLGFCLYGSTAVGWLFAMRYVKLATLGVFYSISTVLFLTIVGALYFREPLSAIELFGVALGVSTLVLLSRFG